MGLAPPYGPLKSFFEFGEGPNGKKSGEGINLDFYSYSMSESESELSDEESSIWIRTGSTDGLILRPSFFQYSCSIFSACLMVCMI